MLVKSAPLARRTKTETREEGYRREDEQAIPGKVPVFSRHCRIAAADRAVHLGEEEARP